MLPYILILVTVLGNTVGLILVKKAVIDAGQAPSDITEFIPFFLRILTSLYTWLAVLAVFIGLLAFWVTLTKMELSRAYPIIGGLSYILVALVGILLFREQISVWGWMGVVLVAAGVMLLLR